MTEKQLTKKLNKELVKKNCELERCVQLLLIYIHCLPKETFFGLLSDSEKHEASKLGRLIGKKRLKELALPHAASTIFDWLPKLLKKIKKVVGRKIPQATIDWLLRIVKQTPNLGIKSYFAIMRNLGLTISISTIRRVLREHGVWPFKRRGISFMEKITNSIKWHACDFAKITIDTLAGQKTISILFFINIKTRKVCIIGCTENPDAEWTRNMMRNVSMADWGFMKKGDCLIHDGDGCFISPRVQELLKAAGIETSKTPPYSPNCNAFAERFVKTLRWQCLSRSIFFSQKQLRSEMKSFENFYNHFRNHQGVGNVLLCKDEQKRIERNTTGKVKRIDHGLGNYYYCREAA